MDIYNLEGSYGGFYLVYGGSGIHLGAKSGKEFYGENGGVILMASLEERDNDGDLRKWISWEIVRENKVNVMVMMMMMKEEWMRELGVSYFS